MLLITIYLLIKWLSLLVKLRDLVSRPATSVLPCDTRNLEILPVRYLICEPTSYIIVLNPLDIRATHTDRVDLCISALIATRLLFIESLHSITLVHV
jgi:hypothetical protein